MYQQCLELKTEQSGVSSCLVAFQTVKLRTKANENHEKGDEGLKKLRSLTMILEFFPT